MYVFLPTIPRQSRLRICVIDSKNLSSPGMTLSVACCKVNLIFSAKNQNNIHPQQPDTETMEDYLSVTALQTCFQHLWDLHQAQLTWCLHQCLRPGNQPKTRVNLKDRWMDSCCLPRNTAWNWYNNTQAKTTGNGSGQLEKNSLLQFFLKFRAISVLLGEAWKNLQAEEREAFSQKAKVRLIVMIHWLNSYIDI